MSATLAKPSRPVVSCGLRGVLVDGERWAWGRVSIRAGEHLDLHDDHGKCVRRLRISRPLGQLIRRAQRRWLEHSARAGALNHTERTERGWWQTCAIWLPFAWMGVLSIVIGARAVFEWRTAEAIVLVALLALGVRVMIRHLIMPIWRGRARWVRVHPGGVEVERPGGRRESATWSQVTRVRSTGVGLRLDLRDGARLWLPAERPRLAEVVLAYLPGHARRPIPWPRTARRLVLYVLLGSAIIPIAAWLAGERGERLVAAATVLPGTALLISALSLAIRALESLGERRWRRGRCRIVGLPRPAASASSAVGRFEKA